MPKILQLKITLNNIKPEIWRRFLVEDNINFHQLHKIIQTVMGWEDYHMYGFIFEDVSIIGQGEGFCVDSVWLNFKIRGKTLEGDRTKINNYSTKENMEFLYVYDLGDTWEHTIFVEKILERDKAQKYPLCIAGDRNCPPEDCGGVGGYEHLLEVKKNKNHKEYNELIVDWLGEDYESELFVLDWVNAKLHGKKPKPVWMWKRETPKEPVSIETEHKRKLGRNEPCHCDSGIKYKKCCLDKDVKEKGEQMRVDY